MEPNKITSAPMIRLNTKRIPVLPPGSTYLMQSMMDESLNFRQLASIVERYPSIAARLIALANSVWSSPVSPIHSLEMACSRLGFGVVRSTCIALSVSSPFDPTHCPAFDTKHFWSHLLLVADTSTWLAQLTPDEENVPPQTVRAAGLLHDLGLLWLVDQLPEESQQAILLSQKGSGITLSRALLEMIGIDHRAAGRYLGEAWNLPEPLLVAMSHRSAMEQTTPYWQIASAVNLADCLVSAMGKEIPCPVSDKQLQALGLKHQDVGYVMQLLYRQKDATLELARMLFSHASDN